MCEKERKEKILVMGEKCAFSMYLTEEKKVSQETSTGCLVQKVWNSFTDT